MDAIIAMWEGIEIAKESNHNFAFFKIDFDKVYDKLEWDSILQCLQAMGLNPPFISYVQTLFGNAKARVALNR